MPHLIFILPSLLILYVGQTLADFHILNCNASLVGNGAAASFAVSAQPINCLEIGNSVIIGSVDGTIGETGQFSIQHLCDSAPRLDVYPDGTNAFNIFVSGGNGTKIGSCARSNPPGTYDCPTLGTGMSCTDNWSCTTSVCPAVTLSTSPSSTSIAPSSSSPSSQATSIIPPAQLDTPSAMTPAVIAGIVVGSVVGLAMFSLLFLMLWRANIRIKKLTVAGKSETSVIGSRGRPFSLTIPSLVGSTMPDDTISPFPSERQGQHLRSKGSQRRSQSSSHTPWSPSLSVSNSQSVAPPGYLP